MAKNTRGIEVAEIISDKCIACQICIAECPVGAIELNSAGVAEVDPELCVGCGKCFDSCPVNAVRFEKKKRRPFPLEKAAEPGAPQQKTDRGVAVFIETVDGRGAPVSWELTGKAGELARQLDAKVLGFVLGSNVSGVAEEAIAYGCDEVHLVDDPRLSRYLPATFGKALSDLCEKVRPEIFLIGATALGRDLAGAVATRLQTGLTADCTGLFIEKETGLLLMTRPTFGGNIMATIFCQRKRPQMSSVRPRVFAAPQKDGERKGIVSRHKFSPPTVELPEFVQFIPAGDDAATDIVSFPALVVAGRGACDRSSLPLLEELAQLVGGVLACSRPVVQAGLLPYERQVGQTGRTVAPRLYIGVGVSGAVQHLVAIQGAEKILAINSDPNAPIFRVADAGIVGNYQEIVPELIARLRDKRS
ncbi:MAG: electron transfer flavoprotein subunit alpha [Syntrophobacteraceae bacterium]|nr:electron transfer flavoprotein subunit alpha [Syntrophobacteraceae bacterium]